MTIYYEILRKLGEAKAATAEWLVWLEAQPQLDQNTHRQYEEKYKTTHKALEEMENILIQTLAKSL